MASASAAAPPRLKQAALARTLGVSRQAIGDLIKRQIIPMAADGLVDVEMARIAIANRVRPSGKTAASMQPGSLPPASARASNPAGPAGATTAPPDDDLMSYHVAKTLREVAEAKLAQLKLAELRGDLIRREDMERAVGALAAGLRESVLQIKARLAPLLAAESDIMKISAMLDAELRAALNKAVG